MFTRLGHPAPFAFSAEESGQTPLSLGLRGGVHNFVWEGRGNNRLVHSISRNDVGHTRQPSLTWISSRFCASQTFFSTRPKPFLYATLLGGRAIWLSYVALSYVLQAC